MKAFLMYPDRDFDLSQEQPWNEAALTQDLALDTLFEAMANRDPFLRAVARQAVLNSLTNLDEIGYRQAILKDCLKNPEVVRAIYQIPLESIRTKQKRWMGVFSRYPSGILSSAAELLRMFVALLKQLRQIGDQYAGQFESEGFRRFFEMLQTELDDDYFALVEDHLQELTFRKGVLLSVELGAGNEGAGYLLRRANRPAQGWLKQAFEKRPPVYSFTIHPRDEHGARAVQDLKDRGLNAVANALAQSADHIDHFFQMLRAELAFYLGCLTLSEELARLGEPVCFPQALPAGERSHAFEGLYDVCLALTMQQPVVGNEAEIRGKELIVITGANQGGKSTFLRSIGLAQLMLQCGMFVPAVSFRANLCDGLFTHFKREEDSTMESGKLDEELARMSGIVDRLRPDAMLLFNESFAATNEREGSEIARQIVLALLEGQIKVFFVTHLYTFARRFFDEKPAKVFFLRAERQPDGQRSFKLQPKEPLQTSFGEDLYVRIFETDLEV